MTANQLPKISPGSTMTNDHDHVRGDFVKQNRLGVNRGASM
jgi:hypothetical protein